MSKKPGTLSKKRTVLVVIGSIVLAAGLGAAYYSYAANQKQQAQKAAEQKKEIDVERQKLDDTAFRGNRELAATYIAKVQDNQPAAAYEVYESAAQKSNDDAAKIALYEQAVTVAYRAKQTDHAIKYAVRVSDLADNYRASSNVADIYRLNKDYENQKKYLQKALDQIETLPKESAEYREMKAYYQDLLSKVGTN